MISAIETVPRLSIHPSRGSWNTRGLRVQRQSIEPACVQNRQHHSNIFSLAGVLIRALINACYDALVSPFSTAPSPSLSLSSSSSPSSSVFLPLVRFPSVPPFSTPTLTSPRNLQRAIRINIHIAGMPGATREFRRQFYTVSTLFPWAKLTASLSSTSR